MRSTFKQLFYINRAKVKSDGTTAVLCRISIDGNQSVITTGIYCKPEYWNAGKGTIKTERENNRLIEFRSHVEHTYAGWRSGTGTVAASFDRDKFQNKLPPIGNITAKSARISPLPRYGRYSLFRYYRGVRRIVQNVFENP